MLMGLQKMTWTRRLMTRKHYSSFTTIITMSSDKEQLLAMGQEEGMRQAVGQIDALLAEPADGHR